MKKEKIKKVMNSYSNAFTEVYEVLNHLQEEELLKIPHYVLKIIKENRNLNYKYQINSEISLREQSMLIETKAILFNLFRDYLATPEQREKIIKMQQDERVKNENTKREKYNPNNLFKNNIKQARTTEIDNNFPTGLKKDNFFKRVISYIKNLLRNNVK